MKRGVSPRGRIVAVLVSGILGGIVTTKASAVDIDTRPGHCPGFSADQIDRIANELGLEADSPESLQVDCRDNAELPMVELEIETSDKLAYLRILIEATGKKSGTAQIDCYSDELACPTVIYDLSHPADTYVCRAEVLRSVTWRRLCPPYEIEGRGQ